MTPAPDCLKSVMTCASTSLFHGHCPYFSIDFSSIVTIPMSDDKLCSSCCMRMSNDFNFNISFTNGSCKPVYVRTTKVTNANVQCVINFHN